MAEEQKHDITSNTSDSATASVSNTEHVDETATDIPETIPPQSKAENVNKETIQVTVNIPKEENKAAITANKIAIFGTLINLALAGMTYLLYQKTIQANKTSQLALQEAKRANDISAQALVDARKADSISDIKDSLSYTLNKSQYENNRKKTV
jgi:hypothetical protein